MAKHRGETVDAVIAESIDGYLSSLSFNSVKDITDILYKLDLPQPTLGQYYASLGEMISRRHQIVHEGDMKRGQKSFELEPVNVDQIGVWVNATAEFCAQVLRLITDALYIDKLTEHLARNGIQASREQIAGWISIEVKAEF